MRRHPGDRPPRRGDRRSRPARPAGGRDPVPDAGLPWYVILPLVLVAPRRGGVLSQRDRRRGRWRTLFLAPPRRARMVQRPSIRRRRPVRVRQPRSSLPSPGCCRADARAPARSPSTRSRSVPARLPRRPSHEKRESPEPAAWSDQGSNASFSREHDQTGRDRRKAAALRRRPGRDGSDARAICRGIPAADPAPRTAPGTRSPSASRSRTMARARLTRTADFARNHRVHRCRPDGRLHYGPGARRRRSSPGRTTDATKEELLEDIRAEAAEKRAERKQLTIMKDRARERGRGRGAGARSTRNESMFREQLERDPQSRSSKAGKEIDDLCDQYGRVYDPSSAR